MLLVTILQIALDRRDSQDSRPIAILATGVIVAACNAIGVIATDQLKFADLVHAGVYSAAVVVLWWLTTMACRLHIVWRHFVAGRLHLDTLAARWKDTIRRECRAQSS
jgi:hypothetical protein